MLSIVMKPYLHSGQRLQHIGCRRSFPYLPTVLYRLSGSLGQNASNWRIDPNRVRSYSSHSSVQSTPRSRALPLQYYALTPAPKIPINVWQRKSNKAWVEWLEKYLPPELRTFSSPDHNNVASGDILAQGREVLQILQYARRHEKDPLVCLGFQLDRWPAVHALLSLLLDAADSVHRERVPRGPVSNLDWGSASGLSLAEVTYAHRDQKNAAPVKARVNRNLTSDIDLDTLTARPFANELSQMLVGQVFLSLGEIILYAAGQPPEQSRHAMSYVFRILARLHHSDLIPDRIYRYVSPDDNETTFRPPGMHLLATHIMRTLSDAAWADHEAELIAKGERSPFIPYKMIRRELGPEIWLEFILWCCVEHGIREVEALLKRIITQDGPNAWHFQSWRPLLQDSEAVWKTDINSEDFWRSPKNQDPPSPRNKSTMFYGLGKRTISSEVVMSIIDSMTNQTYSGMAWRGLAPRHVIPNANYIRRMIAQSSENKLEPTTKAINAFAVRLLESGTMVAHSDPYTFDEFLSAIPNAVPPWDDGQLDKDQLSRLSQSRIYNETSAFAGLMEYNIQIFALLGKSDRALDGFKKLLDVVDESKRQHIIKSFELINRPEGGDLPTFNANYPPAQEGVKSCIPQMSKVTLARLVDAAKASQNFEFADWLLFSDDIDGPAIPPSVYGDQVLAPSLLRYATETGNKELHTQVVRSLSQPLSLNMLRALINSRISMGEWDNVVELFSFIRDNRAKSWGFSNISTLATSILTMDHRMRRGRRIGETPPDASLSLSRAKNILLRILNGEFDTPQHIKSDNYYQLVVYSLRRLFKDIPGPLSEVAKKSKLRKPPSTKVPFPILPTESFNDLFAAVVDIYGSIAGFNLWRKWLVDRKDMESRRLHQGGVKRLYTKSERDPAKGHQVFDHEWFNRIQMKIVYPNVNTIKILTRKAVDEQAALLAKNEPISDAPAEYEQQHEDEEDQLSSQHPDEPTTETREKTLEKVLDFCVLRSKELNATDEEINLETDVHLKRMINEGKLRPVPRRRRGTPRVGYPPKWTS